MTQKQGIVSILGSDKPMKPGSGSGSGSLKRTLSADMSSRRWMAQNGLMKKVASSEQIQSDSSSDEEESEQLQNPRQLDIWTAILSQKTHDETSKLPPPYVHPLVKKSASSLSDKSLKVCTESLGSETGSDVFSSEEKQEDEEEEEVEIKESDGEEPKAMKHTHLTTTKKAQPARSFPPPLASLAAAHAEGPSLHMHSRRVDGRLVLEAVSVPSQNYFATQRQDGRFLLTLINNPKEEEEPKPRPPNDPRVEFDDVFDTSEEEEEETDEMISKLSDKDIGILKNHQTPNSPSGVISMHRSMVTMKRITKRDNTNPSWCRKQEKEERVATPPPPPPSPRSNGLPPLPTTSFNSYHYFWRAKPTVASVIDPLITQHRPPTKNKSYEKKDLVVMRGNKVDCLLPSLKGCKEPRRSLLMWEPFCIATS